MRQCYKDIWVPDLGAPPKTPQHISKVYADNMKIMPITTFGKWTIGLASVFIMIVVVSCTLVFGLEILSFDDSWWDVTVAVAFPISILALIIGVYAVKTHKESSVLVYLSIVVGLTSALFILLHSLFIND